MTEQNVSRAVQAKGHKKEISAASEMSQAAVDLRVGQIVLYTELVTGNRGQDAGRAAKPRVRAAIVVFVLDDGADRRPVLRVLNPMAPPMTAMPEEGVVHTGVALADQEINAPVRNYYLVCAQELQAETGQ